MDESYNFNSVRVIRRAPRQLPSFWRHLRRAVIVLIVTVSGIFALLHILGNPGDAIAIGEVKVEPLPQPLPSDHLANDTGNLPDLYEGEIPDDVNPTERLDALGNPRSAIPNSDLVGGNDIAPPGSGTIPITAGPRTILIDGKPIGGGSFVPEAGLPRAPLPGLTRQSPFGKVPAIASDGRKAVTSYARPYTPNANKKPVALIIGGLGIDPVLTQRVIHELPPNLTLSFAAHTQNLQTWINQARDYGHEVLIELPMEAQNHNPAEPGADKTLMADASAADNIRNLDYLLSRAQGFYAVTNYNGDRLLSRSDNMTPILTHLADSGLGFIYDGSLPAPSLPALASAAGLTMTKAYAVLDNDPSPTAIRQTLDTLKVQAGHTNPPIGIGFALPQTIDTVKIWLDTLDAAGLELAPASYVLSGE